MRVGEPATRIFDLHHSELNNERNQDSAACRTCPEQESEGVSNPTGRQKWRQSIVEGPSCEEPVCTDEPYPRYEPGVYEAECISARTYRHPLLNVWKCR